MAEVKPYSDKEGSKKEQVREMFNNISHRYDFLNHFLSIGIDRMWRKKAIRILAKKNPKKILDVATGTGDFAIEALRLNPDEVIGVDISEKMLEHGNDKIARKGYSEKVKLVSGDSENLQFEDNTFDAITVGFGVRNFENLSNGMKEMNRVLKTDGELAVLEFSKPKSFPFKQIYYLYFTRILPAIGAVVSKDKRAYTYLHESVDAFPEGEQFVRIMQESGFSNVVQHRLMNGIATIYVGKK